jgi:ligand-binding SRPBCC domain-containing protein
MAVYSFKTIQKIPISIEEAWQFFSNPANLSAITPSQMQFKIISNLHGEKMYPGQLIEYKVSPLLRIPLYWMTEITHVKDHAYFIDEQRFGPYSLWHHQHHFKIIEGGVEMTDIIHYKVPLGWLGVIANKLFVANELKRIFTFRKTAVELRFGIFPS